MEYKLDKIKLNKKRGLIFLKTCFSVYKRSLFLMLFLLALVAFSDAFVPKLIEYIVNNFIVNPDYPSLINFSLLVFLVTIIAFICQYFQTKLSSNLSQKVLFDIRARVFVKLQSLPLSFYSQNQSGQIIQRINRNVSDIDRFFQQGFTRLSNITFSLLFVLVFLFLTNWQVALICLSGVFLITIFLLFQGKILHRLGQTSQKLDSDLTTFEKITLDGHKTITSFNRQFFWLNHFQAKNTNYLNFIKKNILVNVSSDALLSLFSTFIPVIVLVYSLNLYTQNILMSGTVMLLLSYSFKVFKKMGGISRLWQNIQTGIVAAERLDQILSLKSNILNSPNPHIVADNEIKGSVEFKDVVFSYQDNTKPVLKGLNLKVKAGQSVAIVGQTGGGKTTFVNLISRLYDVSKGQVLVDGVDVKKWNIDSLRGSIGYLIQNTFLFEDTIYNNLRYNNPTVSRKQALGSFKKLGASKLIKSLPKGLDTLIDSQGQNLSAGQKQIVTLARVLLTNPKILVLDEATAKIDTKSEKMIQNAIQKSTKNITSFIIAHRLSTIFGSDLIIVISDNTIVEAGSHQDLLKKKGVYAKMYSQFIS